VVILNKKVMFIVEGLMHPTVPPLTNLYPAGFYFPNWVEWSLALGTITAVGLGFVVIGKVIPMVKLHALDDDAVEPVVLLRTDYNRTRGDRVGARLPYLSGPSR
jgi:hypothetical protein